MHQPHPVAGILVGLLPFAVLIIWKICSAWPRPYCPSFVTVDENLHDDIMHVYRELKWPRLWHLFHKDPLPPLRLCCSWNGWEDGVARHFVAVKPLNDYTSNWLLEMPPTVVVRGEVYDWDCMPEIGWSAIYRSRAVVSPLLAAADSTPCSGVRVLEDGRRFFGVSVEAGALETMPKTIMAEGQAWRFLQVSGNTAWYSELDEQGRKLSSASIAVS